MNFTLGNRKFRSGLLYDRLITSLRRRRELYRLFHDENESTVLLTRSIKAVIKKRFDSNERAFIETIEKLRDNLASSNESMTYVDYGAGHVGDRLTSTQMYCGRVVTTSLKTLCQRTSKSYPWTHLIFKIVREFKPAVCLELGTCIGLSAAYQAAALEMNQFGQLVTIEGAASLAGLARENFDKLGLKRVRVKVGRFQDVLEDTLREQEPIEFVFIDGHHDGHATVRYFHQMLPFLAQGAVVLFDDILSYEGMRRAWNDIMAHKKVVTAIDLMSIGLCVIGDGPRDKDYQFCLD